jgi:hypothetical protein
MIVTGDTTQIDLPDPTESGLIDAARRLRRVRGIGFCVMDKTDIVRHHLVQRIVEAYAAGGNRGGEIVEAAAKAYASELSQALTEGPPTTGGQAEPAAPGPGSLADAR